MHGTICYRWWDTWFNVVHGADLLQVVGYLFQDRWYDADLTGGGIFGLT